MSYNQELHQWQIQLAAWYTNAALREDELELHKHGMSAEEVNIFAEGLKRKRLHQVESLLPFSFAKHSEYLREKFLQYSQQERLQGLHLKHTRDAIAFASWVEEWVPADTQTLLRWERFLLRCSLPEGNFYFHQNPYRLFKQKASDSVDAKILRRKEWVIGFRVMKKKAWKIFHIPLPF
ncbi:MAG: hypothetical protein MUF42_06335 [Cytophagaceae bacterium]|jgi:hypothetical protein|nr:hypothetical protein [Cytophagaceae bacterium]